MFPIDCLTYILVTEGFNWTISYIIKRHGSSYCTLLAFAYSIYA